MLAGLKNCRVRASDDEIAKENPKFAKIYGPWKAFRDDIQLWWRVAEFSFDQFVLTNPVKR